MCVNVVFCVKQVFQFIDIGVKLDPLLVGRLRDAASGNASKLQPRMHCSHARVGWSEEVMHLTEREVLPVTTRVWVGATFTRQ